ncbi:transcription factor SFL2-like [Poecilia reticulata]|uniref:transcription factor SFL2-like n=1 Tax=Poecilia reticulata TaxID=8081 RepID=UPI0004A417DE|nr:PREDICTED: transcription factor SFL2-like [Poecilia reticulata]
MAAINRPLPAHCEPDARIPSSGVASFAQQDPGPHSAVQDPGFSPHAQHPIFARPVFYIPAPPPPPLLQYQWPIPFSYNPFPGFPSMGYGMIAPPPPLPLPPYMEAPGYILPHPHVQPVDYRRLHHSQSHTQGASHQNPNQMRRIRPNHFIPVRETVNSEVQTEPTQRGMHGYDMGSDSGRGSRSNSPCSPALISPKQALTEVVVCKSPSREEKDLQVNKPFTSTTVITDFHKQPVESTAVESSGSTRQDAPFNTDQEPIPDLLSKDGDYNMRIRSPDGLLPVSSSSQKDDEVLKERHISVPDILMSWGGGTPQTALLKTTDVELSHTDIWTSSQHDVELNKPLSHNSTETNIGSVKGLGTAINEGMASPKVSEMLFRSLRLPYSTINAFLESSTHEEPVISFSERRSLTFIDDVQHLQNFSNSSKTEVQENPNEAYLHKISDVAPRMSACSCQVKRKSNESIWSVESLPAYVPPREWLLQNGMLELNEEMEEAENVRLSNQNENLMNEDKRGRSLSACVSVQVPESCLCSSIQEEEHSPVRETGTEIKGDVSESIKPEQSQNLIHSKENVLSPSSALPRKAASTPTERDETENRSSEPEVGQSPNQNTLINELQQKSLSSSEEMSLDSAAEEISSSAIQLISQKAVDIKDEVPIIVENVAEVSPSKGTLVDCGVQCNEFHEQLCLCGELKNTETNRRHHFKSSEIKKVIDGRNGHMQRRKNGQWRGTGQERQFNHQEAHGGYCRGGKTKGGRNPRY